MMIRLCTLISIALFCIAIITPSFAAEAKKEPVKTMPAVAARPAPDLKAPAKPFPAPNFTVIFGSVTKVDMTDPAKPVIEIKNTADDTLHVVEITPWTNVTKVTDISELKTGDTVRVMTRKVNDKETAMTVVFGKIRNLPTARPVVPTVPPPAPAVKKEAAKK
jgi:Cu/Ag efflux protein CusF